MDIKEVVAALNTAFALRGYDDLGEEQIEALGDATEWPGMLDDFEARLGIDVTASRAALTEHARAELAELEAELEAVRGSDRDKFATLAGRIKDINEALETPLYRCEFPDFDAPEDCEALLRMGFEDASWHNDAMPAFEKPGHRVMIDYRNPALSEFSGGARIVWAKRDASGEMTDEYREFESVTELSVFLVAMEGGAA